MSYADDKLPRDQRPSNTANVQMPMSWPYNMPPFMYNLQNPIQQVPPYPGYPLNNVQSVPPYLLRNMHWPSNLENANLNLPKESSRYRKKKSSATRKERSIYKQEAEDLEEDQQTESSDSDSESESNSDEQLELKHSSKDDPKRKKHRRKSSGTVVIRNINYITPKRRNGNEGGVSDESSTDEDFIDEEAIKQKVGIAIGSLQKVHKVDNHANRKKGGDRSIINQSNGASEPELDGSMNDDVSEGGKKNKNWDAFQNLLKIDDETRNDGAERLQNDVQDDSFMVRNTEERMSYAADPSPDLEFKEVPKKSKVPNDSFIVSQRDGGNGGGAKFEDYVDSTGPIRKSRDNVGEEMLFSHKLEESGNDRGSSLSTYVSNSSINKCRNAEDWFIVDHSENTRSPNSMIVPAVFDGDCILSSVDSNAEKRSGCAPVDDSFMVQGQLVDNDLPDSQWKTDIDIVADLNSASKLENDTAVSQNNHGSSKNHEPNDLCVVLQRDSGLDPVEASWNMDYEIDFSYSETNRRSSVDDLQSDVNKKLPVSPKKTEKSKVPGTRNSAREEKTKALRGKGKPEIIPRNKKPSTMSRPYVHKSKLEKVKVNIQLHLLRVKSFATSIPCFVTIV